MMWGQRQSMLITHSLTLGTFQENLIHNKPIDNAIAISKNSDYEMWFEKNEKERWMNESKNALKPEIRSKAIKRINDVLIEFGSYLKFLRSLDYSQVSNKELCNFLDIYQDFHIRTLHYFCYSNPQSTNGIESRIKEILRSKNIDFEKFNDYFLALSTPSEFDETMLERMELTKLQEKKVTEDELLNHALCFPALFFNVYSEQEVIQYLKNKLNEHFDESNALNSFIKRTKEKHKKIYKEYENKELEELSTYLQTMSLYRYKLKHLWSGSEFVALPLFKEISKRTTIPLKELFAVYLPEEIKSTLLVKTLLLENEKQDRIKCTVLKLENGTLNFYFGEEALIIVNNLSKAEVISDKLTGQTANRGSVTGIARVVFVKDIAQFEEDLRNFKEGEILVTTMTSPLVIPIIKKSAGIVTDEGGICSHAAIVSREFNIPCVVGTHFATKNIKTGDVIELDATNGVVSIKR